MKPTCGSTAYAKSKKRNYRFFTEEQREVIYQRFWGLTWGEHSAVGTRIEQLSQETKQPSKDNILLPDPHKMPEEIDVHISHKKRSVMKKRKKFVTPAEQKLHKKLVQLRVTN